MSNFFLLLQTQDNKPNKRLQKMDRNSRKPKIKGLY